MASSSGASAQELSNAVAAATAEVISLDQTQGVTSKQLKQSLRKSLDESGVMSNVKAQIRKEFINSMLEKSAVSKLIKSDEEKRVDLQTRIALSSAYHLLKKRGYKHSLSVFAAEASMDIAAAARSIW